MYIHVYILIYIYLHRYDGLMCIAHTFYPFHVLASETCPWSRPGHLGAFRGIVRGMNSLVITQHQVVKTTISFFRKVFC